MLTLIFYRTKNDLSNFCVIISENKRKRFVFNHMGLFYFREKPTTLLRHGSKNMKKHMFKWKYLFVRRFLHKWRNWSIYENEWKWGKHIQNGQNFRSRCQEVFCKKGVFLNFAKFAGKHLSRDSFLRCRLTLAQVLPCENWEISKNTFSWKTPPVTASDAWLRNCRSILSLYEKGNKRYR